MTWTISSTTNFLNALLDLPRQVSEQVPRIIKELQENPVNRRAVKIRGYDNILRIHLTPKYRLFYTYGSGSIKLLTIFKKEKDIYDNLEPITELESFLIIDEEEFDEPKSQKIGLLSPSQLEHWLIPQEYWKELLDIENDNELLELSIPLVYIERIVDNLYPKSLDEINNKAELSIKTPGELDQFLTGEITGFLLKLNEQQERLLNFESDGPILIKGGPGTGKSVLALYRVEKLVKSHVRNILFTTHTLPLVNYSTQLLNALLGKQLVEFGIEVNTVDNIARRFYNKKYGNPQIANKNFSKFCLDSAIKIIKLPGRLNRTIINLGYEYLLEEILNVIEAREINSLDWYRDAERFGRRHPLNREMREAIWKIYQQWKTLISESGYVTIEQVRRKALEIASEENSKPYEAVIIDEAQDLSPVALKFLVQLASSAKGIYLTADVSQSLYQRAFSWELIQRTINFNGETKTLIRSFRNTREISQACPEIFSSIGEIDAIIREFSRLNGSKPKIILTDDILKQASKIKSFFQEASQRFRLPVHSGAVLLPNSELGQFIAHQLTFNGLKAEYMEAQDIDITKSCIKVLTLHSCKGLEFPFVAVVGLTEGILPQSTDNIPNLDKQEVLDQERRLFYVGCSRAMRSLLVCGSKSNPSQFLLPLRSNSFWEMEEI